MIPDFKVDPQWFNLDIFQDMQPILTIKEKFNEIIGPEIPTSFDAIIRATGNLYSKLKVRYQLNQHLLSIGNMKITSFM